MKQPLNNLPPLTHWLLCHLRAFIFGVGELARTPLATFMTLIVIGIAMALPAGLYVMLCSFQNISAHWQGHPSISLYLQQDISSNQQSILIQRLKSNPDIAQVTYISPEQGLAEFAKLTQFGSALAELKQNPLPAVLVITPPTRAQTPNALQALLSHLKTLPEVNLAQLDMAWMKRLYYMITLGERITYTLALLFGVGVILIIGNTIRLTTQHHRQEIVILKLVGATPAFIRRPLLYRGLLYGLLGGAIAWILVSLTLWWLEAPAQALANTYDNTLLLKGLTPSMGLNIVVLCAVLGLTGAWLTVSRIFRNHP